ncbi:hypothetical protein LEMA_P074690.1 [Plenodomus lingam JN3]|uniref:Centromere protein H C-terminal domain-containing protein n=1 Tax=Leptosphaeria maculans (strain JN3 / isolate v23.1.3 / race Av1-4-5-6-7-8) TaxID=985895 RepID=E5A8D5_LEPMJ|nr:hypothetical protein LEMA_P074690.1 [Plenodomus lingam JN3]CBX99880.1 hypothetical protein LEMA_P074690.1 [Plenodomus lingam JN3]
MEAKAEYELRNRITHNVLVMDPVLKAVHGDADTRAAEKRLLPLITENNIVSMVHGAQTTKLASVTRALSTAEQANMIANRKNRELAQRMLALAEDMKAQSVKDIEDPQLRAQVDAVEKALKESRRRKKTVKGILSAMIVGSGIHWAADAELTELVMDDDDERRLLADSAPHGHKRHSSLPCHAYRLLPGLKLCMEKQADTSTLDSGIGEQGLGFTREDEVLV